MPITATKTNSKTSKAKSFKTKKTSSSNKTSWKSTRSSSPTSWFNQFNSNFISSAKSWGWTPSQISACSKAFSACFSSWNTFSNSSHSNGNSSSTTTKKTKKSNFGNGKNGTTKGTSSSVPSTSPNFSFDWTKKGRCTIHFGTNPGSSKSNKFPAGTKCVCLQFRVGSSNWKTIATTSKTWFTQIVSNPIPKTLQYRACYVNRNGTKGAWHTVSPNSNKAAA